MNLRSMIAAFGTADGQLAVGGMPLDRLTARVGSTPYFAYDRRLLDERVAALRAVLPPAINLSYAVKANPMAAVVQHLAGLVDALDVASTLEMQTALDTPMPADRVSFAGPGKTTAEIVQAVAAGVTIEMESSTEARRVIEAGETLGVRPRVAIRVNPDFQVKGSGMRMGGGPQQFGVDAEQVPDLVADVHAADLDFVGFHVFAGSQNLNAEILCEAQRKTADLILELADKSPVPVRYVNLGGGFGIPYFDRDSPLDLEAIGANLNGLLDDRIVPRLPDAKVVIELGRYIVGEAGVYVTKIVDRKVSRGRTYLVVDGGLHHHLSASGNFGQVIRRNYPVVCPTDLRPAQTEVVNVVGPLCTPLDLLASEIELPVLAPGDLIAVMQSGAYGLSSSPINFLSHPATAEMLV